MDKKTGGGIHFAVLPESAAEQHVKFMSEQRSKKKPLIRDLLHWLYGYFGGKNK